MLPTIDPAFGSHRSRERLCGTSQTHRKCNDPSAIYAATEMALCDSKCRAGNAILKCAPRPNLRIQFCNWDFAAAISAALGCAPRPNLQIQFCKWDFAAPKCAPLKTWESSFANGTLPFPNALICKQCRAARAQSAAAAKAVKMPPYSYE